MDDPAEEITPQGDFVDKAHALWRFAAVQVLQGRIARTERALHEARSPFRGTRRRFQQVARRAQVVEHVGAVEVEVGRPRRIMEEGGATEFRVGRDRGVLLAGVGFERPVIRVGDFKGRREVHLDAAVIGVGQGRERPRGDVMPQSFTRGDHGVARGGVTDLIGPESECGPVFDGADQEGIPLTGRGGIRIAPEAESERRGQERGTRKVGLVSGLDGFDGTALGGGGTEAGIPIGD